MGIMTGNEEAWLRMMLDDISVLKQMGLPSNLNESQKDEIIQQMLGSPDLMNQLAQEDEEAMHTIMNEHHVFKEPDHKKLENEKPTDWMIREAVEDMGIELKDHSKNSIPSIVGAEIQGYNLIEGKYYLLTFPNGIKATVKLARILTNSMGDDYVFENFGGAEGLTKKSNSHLIGKNEFPLPQQLLTATKFNILK